MRTAHATVTNKYTNETKELTIEAWYGDSRSGFNHFARAFCIDEPIQDQLNVKVKVHYINRTWEEYPFDTVISCAISKYKDTWEKSTPRSVRPRQSRKARMAAAENNPDQMTLGI